MSQHEFGVVTHEGVRGRRGRTVGVEERREKQRPNDHDGEKDQEPPATPPRVVAHSLILAFLIVGLAAPTVTESEEWELSCGPLVTTLEELHEQSIYWNWTPVEYQEFYAEVRANPRWEWCFPTGNTPAEEGASDEAVGDKGAVAGRLTDPRSDPPKVSGSGVERWRPLVAAHFAEVDLALCVMEGESRGDPSAQNPSGASGLFQVMPFWTEKYPGDLFDPEDNVRIAAAVHAEQGWGAWSVYNKGGCS